MEFTSPLWEHHGEGAWVFVTVPADVSEEVRLLAGEPRGFGSVRVEVEVGATTWRTSVFPDAASGCFVLPVKKAVRRAEDVEVGEPVTVRLRVLGSG
ncbi:DUF1905 domain-containing protein [Nocardioides taihuensis]|uniref:DUF1905 domain-containing protein n=1 Tax=Nocardioides taihuensis TaxID=1835606 RepID=A0ABW0BP71_9ACTN